MKVIVPLMLSAKALQEFGAAPQFEFDVVKESVYYLIRYQGADMSFIGETAEEVVAQLVDFLKTDPVVISVGDPIIELDTK
jgi:hypothetical protein